MAAENVSPLIEKLKTLATTTDDVTLQKSIESLIGAIAVGNINNSVGVAIGQNIRMVVNQLNLSANAVAELLDVRQALAASLGLDPDRYRLNTLLADKTRDFVGRTYIFRAIDKFLATRPNGYFVIKGDPGLGKSACLAEYVRRTGCLAHFNVRALGITSARQFLENICAQLIVDYGLPYSNLPVHATQDGTFLMKLLAEAGEKLSAGEQLIIAIDALDEVDLASHPTGANILYLPPVLPQGVYFVMTRRMPEVPLIAQAPQSVLDMLAHPTENREDIEVYLEYNTRRLQLRTWMDRQGLSVKTFIKMLAELSENNFMYLYYVLPEMERGFYQNLDIGQLPVGLEKYYDDHWRQMGMTAKPLPRDKIRIVYILCEAREPVSRKLVAKFASAPSIPLDELAVQEVLDQWEQFLHRHPMPDGMRYSLYHTSFRDFLHRKDVVQAAGVTIEGINALIADSLWDDLFGKS